MEEEKEEIKEVNPHKCRFVVKYGDGSILKGNALSTKDWPSQVKDGIVDLSYNIDGNKIDIKEHKAYSHSVDYTRFKDRNVYHFINVRCLTDSDDVVIYNINLRKVPGSGLKIGDMIMGREDKPEEFDSSWKSAG